MNDNSYLSPHIMHPFSYSYGRSQKTLCYQTLSKVFEETVSKKTNCLAIISLHENITKSFTELNQDVDNLAKAMILILKINKGDVIAVMTANCYNFFLIQYACAKIGAIICPINSFYKSAELEFSLFKTNPQTFFIPGMGSLQEPSVNSFYKVFKSLTKLPQSLKHVVLLDGKGENDLPNGIKLHQIEELLEKVKAKKIYYNLINIDADSKCALFFTSGTTGPSKAAILSHFNIVNNARHFGQRLGFNGDQKGVICLPVPFFHACGAVMGSCLMAICGVTLVIPGYRYTIKSVVNAIVESKCTHFFGVPTMLIDIINYVEDNKIKIETLKSIVVAAATVPFEVVNKFTKIVKSLEKVEIVYGTTETSPIISTPMPGEKIINTLDNVGVPLDFVEVKIVDKESGDIVKIGEKGELMTRGPHVFQGYLGDEIQTRNSIDSANWYNTGDLATMDEKGYIRIVGRVKDIIIRGGLKIYPKEIEEAILSHPYVLHAAVCSIPDDRLGEEICAWVKFKDNSKKLSEDEIKSFCKEKMAYYKVPRKVLFVNEFPITPSGKVQRFRMKQISCQTLGIVEKKD